MTRTLVPHRIPAGTRSTKCRSCRATVWWVPHPKEPQRNIIVSVHDAEGALVEGCALPTDTTDGTGTSHFAYCPDANTWRKTRRTPPTQATP